MDTIKKNANHFLIDHSIPLRFILLQKVNIVNYITLNKLSQGVYIS